MPRLNPVDPKLGTPVRRFLLTDGVQSMRLQATAEPEVRDEQGRKVRDGVAKVVPFENGMVITNRPDWIEAIENSYAKNDGHIVDMDVLDAKAKEDRRSRLMAEVNDDPEFRARLASLLTEIEAEESQEAAEAKAKKHDPGLETVRQALNIDKPGPVMPAGPVKR